ncbi:MAG: DNA gyrase inhibitor YacG [Planctomycetota bacterium]
MMTCSTCGRRFDRDESATPPFCSERCQLIDLGRWFNEEIGVPCEESADATDMDDY